jgi:hypothetical protein
MNPILVPSSRHPGRVSKPEKTPNFGPMSVIRHGHARIVDTNQYQKRREYYDYQFLKNGSQRITLLLSRANLIQFHNCSFAQGSAIEARFNGRSVGCLCA